MENDMAWAVFTREFNWDRPKSTLCFHVLPMEEPQQRPKDVVDAAVEAGFATEFAPPSREEKPALKTKS